MPSSHAKAIQAIEGLLVKFKGVKKLSNRDLMAYGSKYSHGWEVPGISGVAGHELRVLVTFLFPYSPVRIALFPVIPVLTWPHVEEHGLLCLASERDSHSVDRYLEEDILHLIEEARALIQASSAKENLKDFENEFHNYWAHWSRAKAKMFSLCRIGGPSRWVSSWHGKGFLLIADNRDAIVQWMQHRYGKEDTSHIDPQNVPFLRLPRALRPEEYPRTVGALMNVLEALRVNHEMLLPFLANERMKHKSILLGFDGTYGASFAGLRIAIPESIKNGFRGLPPEDILRTRLRAAEIEGAHVTRLDGAWVHGRDHNPQEENLASKSVIIAGLGSIGSTVADMLAKSGVGRIKLLDGEHMESENTSRHRLGATALEKNKASALAAELSRYYPHREIAGHAKTLEDFAIDTPDALKNADLIISTTGSWQAESWLNAWALEATSFPPVLYGWTEAYAAASHAAVFFHRQGCLRCLTSDRGKIEVPITIWDKDTSVRVPGCGAVFQPYGAIEISHAHSLIADLSLDVLLGKVTQSTHAVWIGQRKTLEGKIKGRWNPEWVRMQGDPGQGGKFSTVPFRPNPACPQCGGVQ